MSSLAHLGEVHLRKAETALDAGDLPRARELFTKALGCYDEKSPEAASARISLGSVLAQLGEPAEARKVLEHAVRSLEPAGEKATLARALNQLGLVLRDTNDAATARASFERAFSTAAEGEDRRQRAVALRNLSVLDKAAGDLVRAAQRLVESAELQAAEGDWKGVALVHRQVQKLHLERGDLRRAYESARSELEAREKANAKAPGEGLMAPASGAASGDVAGLAQALEDAGDLATLAGEPDAAALHLKRAVELRFQQKDLARGGRALVSLGHVLLALGQPRSARAKLEAARDALGEEGTTPAPGGPRGGGLDAAASALVRAELWRGFAETDLLRLDALDAPEELLPESSIDEDTATDDARADFAQMRKRARGEAEEAHSLAERTGSPVARAAANRTLARALVQDGDAERAREHFRAAVELAEDANIAAANIAVANVAVANVERPTGAGGSPARATPIPRPDVLVESAVAYGRFLAPRTLRAAVEYLERGVVVAEESRERGGPLEPAARARLALAETHADAGEPDRARVELVRARALLGRPPASEPATRARLRRRADRLEARLALPHAPPVAASTVLRAAESQTEILARATDPLVRDELLDLRRLQAIARQLSAETEMERQLAFLVDAAVEVAGAERGFLILLGASEDKADEVAFRSARNFERAEIERPDRKVSHTIAREVLQTGSSVVTGDAGQDERFRGAGSVAEQRLRSVVAVPLRVRGKVTGVLYLDHRYKAKVFGPRVVKALESLADHASLVLETSRLLAEVKAQSEQLARERERLASQVESQTLELEDMRGKLAESRREQAFKFDYSRIVGRSRKMKEVFSLLDKVTPSTVPVFIQGESGTGKELVARAIHWNGPRKDGPFVSENFSALSDSILESELFGHVKGSFTGAHEDKKGLFEQANGGTIFLDEVGDLSDKTQKDLLRVLEEREVRPIGGAKPIPIDVRVISATHRDLKQMVADGKFRQDLYYRLNVFTVPLPALRERKEDIPLLAERFLDEVAADEKAPPKRLDPAALRRLLAHDWPGNIRELRNLLERTALLAKGDVVRVEDLQLETLTQSRMDVASADATKTWNEAKESFARRYLKEVLARAQGNISMAARESGMLRQAFQRLLKRHGIEADDYRGP